MPGIGRDKGMCIDCKAMEAESEARGQGVCSIVLSTCRVMGAEAVTWSETAESEAKASLRLTVLPSRREKNPRVEQVVAGMGRLPCTPL